MLVLCVAPTAAGDAVTHTIVLHNNGNVALWGLNIGGLNMSSTTVNCSLGEPSATLTAVANPVPNLPVGGYLTCQSTYTFLQGVIELGDAHHVTLASSSNIVPSSSAVFMKSISLAGVTVPNNPGLLAYIHTDDTYCGDHTTVPSKARECMHCPAQGNTGVVTTCWLSRHPSLCGGLPGSGKTVAAAGCAAQAEVCIPFPFVVLLCCLQLRAWFAPMVLRWSTRYVDCVCVRGGGGSA